jgi:hypothetical protein
VLHGDADWERLSGAIAAEDGEAAQHHAGAVVHAPGGPVPFVGAIMTAPVVLLLTHPAVDAHVSPADYAFQRDGWPLAALHPEAPSGLAERWRCRLEALVELFGAQHVSHSVAAVFLSPWPSETFDARVRLPSRSRLLEIGASAAARDALLLIPRGGDSWTEHSGIAALPPTRRFHPKTWRTTRVGLANLGAEAWTILCKRVAVHAWL